jgi:hypothetical protein
VPKAFAIAESFSKSAISYPLLLLDKIFQELQREIFKTGHG